MPLWGGGRITPATLKRRQTRVYNALAVRPALGVAELRRELIRLSCLISAHQ
ncbi:hypothetical protein ACIBEA_30335 [Streptomyces sp. NPDC051555]|uniref:hypothetical protein n=1 Tax=Streptomyces sp. NPDC051555 TaxID=3365657 RepID=UPI0037999B97